jgi:hypothetical protein
MSQDPSENPSPTRYANGRFAIGHPGGPGRPRNPVNTTAQELDRIGIEAAQELLRLILDRARQGNLKAADMVLQRIWPVRRNRPVNMEVPFGSMLPNVLPEHAALAEAMMNGEITPQDAQAATRVLQALQDQVPINLSAAMSELLEKWKVPPEME